MDKLVDYLVIIQARLNSKRLPAKVMLDLSGATLLERVVQSVSHAKKTSHTVVATSTESSDDVIQRKLSSLKIDCFRGSLSNVLDRFFECALAYNAKNIVRVTADNPLICPRLIDKQIQTYEMLGCDYMGWDNSIYGLSSEVFSFEALSQANKEASNDYEFEHVTPYILNNLDAKTAQLIEKYSDSSIRITVDTLEDYIKMQKFFEYCNVNKLNPNIDQYLEYLK